MDLGFFTPDFRGWISAQRSVMNARTPTFLIVAVDDEIWVAKENHRWFVKGDIFFISSKNGMSERFGMTGVSSKGVRLCNCHIPIRYGNLDEGQFWGDFIGKQWNDPDVGRYVADLRAGLRSRVSADSPATASCSLLASVELSNICFNGLFKSGRLPMRKWDFRIYLRFYRDGFVRCCRAINNRLGPELMTSPESDRLLGQASIQGRLSSARNKIWGPDLAQGVVRQSGNVVSFDLLISNKVIAHYEGEFRHGRLHLTCHSTDSYFAHDEIPFRFHPFNLDARKDQT